MKTLNEIKQILEKQTNYEVPEQFCDLIDLAKDEYDDMIRKSGTYTGEELEVFKLVKREIDHILSNMAVRVVNSKAYEVKGLIWIMQQWNREGYGTEENRGKIQDAKDRWKKQSSWRNTSEVKF